MSPHKRRFFRNVVAVLVLVLVTGWVVPSFFNADRYRPLLKAGLENALHRKITFGQITFHLFPQPGFTIDNVVVEEAPAFGLEPFANVQRIDCELLWRSLWHSGLDFSTLQLHHPSINLVRNAAGEWNIENLLLNSGITGSARRPSSRASHRPSLRIEAEDARFNFKLREDKKPFAIVDSRAEIDFDFGSRRVSFRLSGDPVRTDSELPTPGPVELSGTWRPAKTTGSALDATLRTQGALLYDWVPLLTGHNPGIYGVLDSTIHLTGTLRKIDFVGDARLSQVHRWEQLPPSNDLPCRIRFQGIFDRDQRKLELEDFNLAFADSKASVRGSIEKVTSKPDFDLAVNFKQSRVQDLLELGSRVLGIRLGWNLTGNVDGKLEILGPWAERRYEGTLAAREVRLRTPSGAFPISRVDVRIARDRIWLSPARVHLAPGVEVFAEGYVRDLWPGKGRYRRAVKPRYDLTVYSRAVALTDLLRFGRALGLKDAEDFAAEGIGTFTLHATGWAWPLSRPNITAQARIRSARLMIPGLTQPVNIPRARIQIYGKQVIVNPVVAVMGTSVFSGWMSHEGSPAVPWNFSLESDKLSVGQASQWFEATRSQDSTSLFERLSGISALLGVRRPASSLLNRLNAQGHFATPIVSYRALALRHFKATIDIHDRTIRVSKVTFEASSGRGKGKLLVNLRESRPQISGEMNIEGGKLQTLASYLPPALATVRGFYSAAGHFSARGLTHDEITRSLEGQAAVKLESVNLGDFDPISALARRAGLNVLELNPQPALIPFVQAHLQIQNRQVTLENFSVDLSGAELHLKGACGFDGTATLQVHANLSGLSPRLFPTQAGKGTASRLADVRFAGSLRHLRAIPSMRLSQEQP
ncbi:MAG: AsmA family protein [Acidobacteria bacterium]|nr:AsmA family protein [Acidobacteriota bacterium]